MDLDTNVLINIIHNVDSTRIVSDKAGKDSLLRIANQVVTRALQFDPMNENLINANNEILRIEEKINDISKRTARCDVEIVRKRAHAVYRARK